MKVLWHLLLPFVLAFPCLAESELDSEASQGEQFAGIGVALTATEDGIRVFRLIPNRPAFLSQQIQVGDLVVEVGEPGAELVPLAGKNLSEAVELIRGPAGSEVWLAVIPADDQFVKRKVVALGRQSLLLSDKLVGRKMPEITVVNLETETSSDFAATPGRVMILEFWAATCAPCTEQVSRMQEYPVKYPHWNDRVRLVSISVDENIERAKQVADRMSWDDTINLWTNAEGKDAFYADILPLAVVVDRQGKIVAAANPDLVNIPAMVDDLLPEDQSKCEKME